MYREYNTRPGKVLACCISEKGALSKLVAESGEDTGKYRYKEKSNGLNLILDFSCHQEPAVGDYIIQQSKTDIYLCPKDSFESKYVPQGMIIQ